MGMLALKPTTLEDTMKQFAIRLTTMLVLAVVPALNVASAQGGWVRLNSGTTLPLHKVQFSDALHGLCMSYSPTSVVGNALVSSDGGET